jgi:hypothetical protein
MPGLLPVSPLVSAWLPGDLSSHISSLVVPELWMGWFSQASFVPEWQTSIMAHWAKELAEKIKLQEELRRQEEFRRQERARLFASKAAHLWREFVSVLEKDLEEFNKVSTAEKTKVVSQRGPGSRLSLCWASSSRDQLEVRLDSERQAVEYRLSMKGLPEGISPEKIGLLNLPMNDAGEITVNNGDQVLTLEQASEFLLRPILSWGLAGEKHPS